MNRIQFFVLTGLSSLVVLLLICHIFLVRYATYDQNRLQQAQQIVNQAQDWQGKLKQLAVRIYTDSQTTKDPGLNGLLERQHIKYTPGETNAPGTPAAPTPSSTR